MADDPDPVALHDQFQAEAKQKARVVGAYFVQLLAEGVGEYEAMRFTLAFQRRLIPRLDGRARRQRRGHLTLAYVYAIGA